MYQHRVYGLRVPAEEDLHAAHGEFIQCSVEIIDSVSKVLAHDRG